MPYKDKAAQRAYQRDWMKQRRQAWFEANGPCVDCGASEHLEVDHADASLKVAHRVWSWAEDRRLAELEKCVVRCQSCHKKKTKLNGENAVCNHKVSDGTVQEVVSRYQSEAITQKDLGKEYGVSQQSVSEWTRGVVRPTVPSK